MSEYGLIGKLSSPFYLEKGLFSYINHLRQHPKRFVDILRIRKKFYRFEDDNCIFHRKNIFRNIVRKSFSHVFFNKYGAPYLQEANFGPILYSKEEFSEDKIDDICDSLSRVKPLKLINHHVNLSDICRYFSTQEILEMIRNKVIGSRKNFKDDRRNTKLSIPFELITLEYDENAHGTSQQILLDLLLQNDNCNDFQNIIFNRWVSVIGIGFYEHNEWKKMEKQKLVIHIILAQKGRFFINQNVLSDRQKRKNGPSLRERVYATNISICHPFGPFRFRLGDGIQSDDRTQRGKIIAVKDLFSSTLSSRENNSFRNGMLIEDQESAVLEYKCFGSSLNLNRPQEVRWKKKKKKKKKKGEDDSNYRHPSLVDEICNYLRQYYCAFANVEGGRLVIGVREQASGVNIIDGEDQINENDVLSRFTQLMKKVRPAYEPAFGKPEFMELQGDNFEGLSIILMDVQKVFNNGGPYFVVEKEDGSVWGYERSGNHNRRMKGFSAFEKYFMYKDRIYQKEEEEEEEESEGEIEVLEDGKWKERKNRHNFDPEKTHCRCCRRNDIVIKKSGEKFLKDENISVKNDLILYHRCKKRFSQSWSFRKRKLGEMIFAHGENLGELKHICDPEMAVKEKKCSVCNQVFTFFVLGSQTLYFE